MTTNTPRAAAENPYKSPPAVGPIRPPGKDGPQPLIVVPPSLKFTVPVGLPEPLPVTLTVAVSVTNWPNTEGLTDDATAALVLALPTV